MDSTQTRVDLAMGFGTEEVWVCQMPSTNLLPAVVREPQRLVLSEHPLVPMYTVPMVLRLPVVVRH